MDQYTGWIRPAVMKGQITGMDGQYSWKRTDEIEIDLADLLKRLCGQWKRIAACALVSATVLGGYGWAKGQNGSDVSVSDMAQEAELTEDEEQAVADAVRLENETKQLETYLENSILMQLDPYHKARYIMLYSIDRAQRRELQAVTESYLSFVQNGGAADAMADSKRGWKTDKSCLAEVITAYQKTYSSPYQVVVDEAADSGLFSESLFYVEITGRDAKEAEKMALDMQDVLDEYSARVKKEAGSHRLKLVSSMESITADSGLQSQQHDKRLLLSSNRANLKTATDAFSSEQTAVYEKETGVKNERNQEVQEAAVSGEGSGFSLKYIILGLMAGVFVYCCVFACWYVFSDTVKNTEEIKRMYAFSFFGGILPGSRNEKKGCAVPEKCHDAYGSTQVQVMNRIRLACKKQGTAELYAVSDFRLNAAEKECLESMACRLRDCGIEMTVAENACMDTSAWDSLTETGNVLLVCRMGTTTHRMIDDALNFYLENGIAVIGAAAFLQ